MIYDTVSFLLDTSADPNLILKKLHGYRCEVSLSILMSHGFHQQTGYYSTWNAWTQHVNIADLEQRVWLGVGKEITADVFVGTAFMNPYQRGIYLSEETTHHQALQIRLHQLLMRKKESF